MSSETVIVDIDSVTNGNEIGEQQQTTSITDDDVPPTLISAKTMDIDRNGFIDHYMLTFSTDMDDISFPGHNGPNSEGDVTTDWLVSGFNNVRINTDDEELPDDVDNDPVIYIKFDEPEMPDTGSKPDLTTTE